MAKFVDVYEFAESAFVVGSDPVVCVVRASDLRGALTVSEIDAAFSGYASYRRAPWMTRYLGVWGKRNCQRFRRFLREIGLEIVIHRERPPHLALTSYVTRGSRQRVRSLSKLESI